VIKIKSNSKGCVLNKQYGFAVWLTGLPASGKTTLSKNLKKKLTDLGLFSIVLDGDNLRKGLNCDLGFSGRDRQENVRRTAEVVKMLTSNGFICIVAVISPFEKDRNYVRNLIGKDRLIEVFVSCPLEICEQRDPKGLYKRARSGKLADFTGLDSCYEIPQSPDVIVQTDMETIDACLKKILNYTAKIFNVSYSLGHKSRHLSRKIK